MKCQKRRKLPLNRRIFLLGGVLMLLFSSALIIIIGEAQAFRATFEQAQTACSAGSQLQPTRVSSLSTVVCPGVGSHGINRGYEHVFFVVLENHSLSVLNMAPSLARLARSGLSAQQYFGVAHPSLPNYLALIAGTTFGVTDDNPHIFNAANLADQLAARGLAWKGYMENMPS